MHEMKSRIAIFLATAVCLAMLIACAPQSTEAAENGTDQDQKQTSAELPTWTEQTDCTTCHELEVNSVTNSVSTYFFHSDQACVSCHSDNTGKLTSAHDNYATAKLPTKLKRTEIDETACLSCHDKEELKDRTCTSTVLTDVNGTVVNPHAIPDSPSHENVLCSDCHKMHSEKPRADVARKLCENCHHKNVYECLTCHQ
jgi:cytochrome c553